MDDYPEEGSGLVVGAGEDAESVFSEVSDSLVAPTELTLNSIKEHQDFIEDTHGHRDRVRLECVRELTKRQKFRIEDLEKEVFDLESLSVSLTWTRPCRGVQGEESHASRPSAHWVLGQI
eukprot:g39164.t1